MNFLDRFFSKPDFLQSKTYEFPLVNFQVLSPSQKNISNFILYSSSQVKRGYDKKILTFQTQLHSRKKESGRRRIYYLDDLGEIFAHDTLIKKRGGLFLEMYNPTSPLNMVPSRPFMGFTRSAFTLDGLYSAYGLDKTMLLGKQSLLEEKIQFLEEFLNPPKVRSLKSVDFIQEPQLYLELLEQEYQLNILTYAKQR